MQSHATDDEVRRIYMPYALLRVVDDPPRYVIVNRHYKPLGQVSKQFVDYHAHAVYLRGLTPRVAVKLSYDQNPNLKSIYLYNDLCAPTRSVVHMQAYLERLAVLARIRLSS